MKQIKLVVSVLLLLSAVQLHAQINSAQSGSWQSASTWVGGVVPDSGTNVNIAAGHLVSIDDSLAASKSITFSDTSAQLKMGTAGSVLKVYGDFTLFSTAHKAFNSWVTGAKIVFTGYALKQTLSGWNTSASSTSFPDMVVDKDTGKVSTGRQNMRFSFANTLEIRRGTFELDSLDDIESRTIGGSGTEGIILVQSKGVFQMVGGSSHIRKGTFTDTVSSRIGRMAVYGKAVLTSTSSNRMNFSSIEIMDGGLVILNTGGTAGYFNPNVITVHNGGVLQSSTTTVVYHPSAYIVLEQGGEFNSATSTTPLPANGMNYSQGTVRFSRSSDQTLPAALTQFNNVYFSGGGVKTLSADITVNGTLSLRGTAALNLGGKTLTYGSDAVLQYGAPGQSTPQTSSDVEFPEMNGPKNLSIYNSGGVTLHANRTIPGVLTLSAGAFDNNGSTDDKVLNLADGATIRRASGTLTAAPQFNATVHAAYISTISHVTTGIELPAAASVLQNLSISSTKGVDLGSDVTVNGILSFESGASSLNTSTFTLNLGQSALITGETGTASVRGTVKAQRNVGLNENNFGGIGFELAPGTDNLTSVSVTRKSGTSAVSTIYGKPSIARNWTILSDVQPLSGRNVTLSWPAGDDNGLSFSNVVKAKVMRLENGQWQQIGSPVVVNTEDPRRITAQTNNLSVFTVLDTLVDVGVEDNSGIIADFVLHQNYPNPFNPSTTIRFTSGAKQFVNLSVYNVLGKQVATVVNQTVAAGDHTVHFDGSHLPSGVYVAVIKTADRVQQLKMMLIK
ncbi:MAG: T9SS type A sorting domain-containing protein [Ignavibacteriales bacterium]|nr:T9SS type A sorting domain-containing protein [Ignavibacteriales bacterium]